MLVAVTGASGHVGANLVRTLLDRGARVRALVHSDDHGIRGLDVERVNGSSTDPEAVGALVHGSERVFHLAAKISLDEADAPLLHKTNVEGPRVVTDACRKAGVKRLVHFSSIHAISSEPKAETIDETRPLASGSGLLPYDRSKSAGETIVRAAIDAGLDAVIVNPTGIIGPFDYGPSHMGELLLQLYHGRMPGLVQGGFNWVDVRDVVAGALFAAEKAPRGARYLLSGHWHTLLDIATIVQAADGHRPPLMVPPMWLARSVAPFAVAFAKIAGRRPLFTAASLQAVRNHRHISSDRAVREIGYSARPIEETVKDTLNWFRAEGKLK